MNEDPSLSTGVIKCETKTHKQNPSSLCYLYHLSRMLHLGNSSRLKDDAENSGLIAYILPSVWVPLKAGSRLHQEEDSVFRIL